VGDGERERRREGGREGGCCVSPVHDGCMFVYLSIGVSHTLKTSVFSVCASALGLSVHVRSRILSAHGAFMRFCVTFGEIYTYN
jgi:hypothetical protein